MVQCGSPAEIDRDARHELERLTMKLSLFSVSYAGFWGQHELDVPSFIAKAAQLGYDAVMIAGKRPHLSPLDAPPDRIASIRAALQQHEIECAVIGGYTDLAPTAAAEVPYLEMQIAYVESLAGVAAQLGASVVRVFTAYEVAGHSPHALWNGVVRTLQEMCDRAAAHGVTIAVQNHHDVGVHTDWLLEILGDVDRPNCKVGFDAWSPALRGEDLYEAARKMAPHTVITTNADYIRLPRFHYQPALVNYARAEPDLVRAVRFGEGFIDYEAFFRGLQEGGFDGIASYEMCSPVRGGGAVDNLDACAAQYLQWMREHVQ
jgi:sugar phosphate isomerase/epimerase